MVGGGAAGLTAALVLARARHRVTVIDDQTYRNATVDEFHGFPTRDATAPNRFRADAIDELHSYGVAIVNSAATGVQATDRSVTMELADGTTFDAAVDAVATGVHDDLPPSTVLPSVGASRRSTARSATGGSTATSQSWSSTRHPAPTISRACCGRGLPT